MKFSGELYSWGKGRYGRLGHGDSEDQTKPKLVEALLGYRVIDVACGSGDAQVSHSKISQIATFLINSLFIFCFRPFVSLMMTMFGLGEMEIMVNLVEVDQTAAKSQ